MSHPHYPLLKEVDIPVQIYTININTFKQSNYQFRMIKNLPVYFAQLKLFNSIFAKESTLAVWMSLTAYFFIALHIFLTLSLLYLQLFVNNSIE